MTKILLVEDDKSLREIYGVRLLAEGYDIVSAGDGEEALAMAIKDRPDLIISDVMMPKISGFDMLDILRSTTETRDIKVIMMTALSSEDQRQRGEQLGADRYLVKSQVGIEDVVRTVHEVLTDAPAAAPAGNVFAAPAPSAVATPAAASAPAEPVAVPVQPAVPMPPVAPTPQPAATPVVEPTAPAPVPAPTQPAAPVASTAPTSGILSSQPVTDTTTPASTLPQPTAPFSTARPANLAERVIQPIQKPEESGPHIADRIDEELDDTPVAPAAAPLAPPPAPAIPLTPTAAPIAPPPAPVAPVMDSTPLNYEETPVAPKTPDQQPPAAV